MSVTFGGQCESAGVRKNGGFVDDLVDLAVGGFDLTLKAGFLFRGSRLIQTKTPIIRPQRCDVSLLGSLVAQQKAP